MPTPNIVLPEQAVAELIDIHGIHAVLEALRDKCERIAAGDDDPHENDGEIDFDQVTDALTELIGNI